MLKITFNKKDTLHDIKIIFEGITSLFLCAAIALGMQFLQEPMIDAGLNDDLRKMINLLGLFLSGLLALGALWWTICSLEAQPASKFFNALSILILALVALAAMAGAVYSSLKHAPIPLF